MLYAKPIPLNTCLFPAGSLGLHGDTSIMRYMSDTLSMPLVSSTCYAHKHEMFIFTGRNETSVFLLVHVMDIPWRKRCDSMRIDWRILWRPRRLCLLVTRFGCLEAGTATIASWMCSRNILCWVLFFFFFLTHELMNNLLGHKYASLDFISWGNKNVKTCSFFLYLDMQEIVLFYELLEKALNIYEGCLTSKDRILYFIGTISVLVCWTIENEREYWAMNLWKICVSHKFSGEIVFQIVLRAKNSWKGIVWPLHFPPKSNVQQKKAKCSTQFLKGLESFHVEIFQSSMTSAWQSHTFQNENVSSITRETLVFSHSAALQSKHNFCLMNLADSKASNIVPKLSARFKRKKKTEITHELAKHLHFS